jgi:hypothetical protein
MLGERNVWQGYLRQGEETINQAAHQVHRPISQLTSTLGIGQSMIHYERNQLVEAHDLLTVILALVDSPHLSVVHLRIRWLLARTLSASGKH